MSTSERIVWIIIGALCLANVAVSLLVLRSRYYSVPQKLAQCFVLWAIPVLGPIAIWALPLGSGPCLWGQALPFASPPT